MATGTDTKTDTTSDSNTDQYETQTLRHYITKEYLSTLEALHFKINSKVDSGYSGIRKSSSKGNSLEFSDFRDYTLGDDLRRIDWKSYSRLDRLFIKRFAEEKQASINIFLDKSKSMDFGQVNKLFFGKLFAATISYLSIKNSDKTNVFCYDEKIQLKMSNIATKNLFSTLVQFLDNIHPQGKTMILNAINEVKHMHLGHGACFIISDFFSMDHYEEAVKLLQNKKQDVYLVHVLSSEEISPNLHDALRLTDSETRAFEDIYVTDDILARYEHACKEYRHSIEVFCRKRGVAYLFAPTDMNVLKLITHCTS